MPPKKGKKKKVTAGPVREPTEFDNDPLEVVEQKVSSLSEALKDVVNKRSYYTLERDTVRTFRDRTVAQVRRLRG